MLCKENDFSLIDLIDIDSSQINSIKYSSNKSCFCITDVPLNILRAEGTHFWNEVFERIYRFIEQITKWCTVSLYMYF